MSLRAVHGVLSFFLVLFSFAAEACPTCGQSFSFTPTTMAISFGFFLMPVIIVLIFVWRIRRSDQLARGSAELRASDVEGSSDGG